ncbi:MAG: serine hydrolase domain-containing protein [Muribaculaceae bacterium]
MKKLIAILLVLLLFPSKLFASEPQKSGKIFDECAFNTDIRNMMDSLCIVGVSLAVVKDNQIVYTGAFGHKDLATLEPLTTSSMFRIASISKSFVATAIMTLVDEGKLTLDTDASTLLNFPLRNPAYPDDKITVEMLLSHTSSINDKEGYYISYDCINPVTNPNWRNCYNSYAPGTAYHYCNLNFNLLGIIIEKVSGERFDHYVERHILNPLDIEGSGFCVNSVDSTKCATLYAWNGNTFEAQPQAYRPIDILDHYQMEVNTVKFSPAGGMKISAPNLAKYMLMHMSYGKSPLNGTRVISEKSAKTMQADHTPTKEHYGLALEKTDEFVKEVNLTGHTGGAYGLTSAMFFCPEKHFGFVVICNGSRKGHGVLVTTQRIMYRHFIENPTKK